MRQARQLANGKAGEIIIAYSAQAAHGPMADLVVRFKNENPSATLSLYQMSSHEQLQAIERGEVDIGFMLSAACKSSLSQLRVCRERFVLLLSGHHPLAKAETIGLSALRDAPFVMGTSKRWETFRSLVNSACVQAGFLPNIVEEADDVPVLLQLVALQRGVTLYGAAISSTLPSQVIAVPISDPHANFDIVVAWDGKRNAPLVDKFVGFLRALITI
ncbi:LysR family substrate-binding domain-containing protein [Mesorhizobium sp. SB112]|uniref:LysR family substrate-binding domain-containing protein n=1 Tax=Mesorhizobium sp. SB112 TaxID=3151853 RepID=UPI003263D25D